MTHHTPEGLPPLPDDDKLEGRLYQDVREFVSPQVKGVIRELMQAYAREALRAQAASVPVAQFMGRRSTPEGTTEFWGLMLRDPMLDPPKGTKLYAGAPPSPASVAATDIDEAALTRMTASGAKAWAWHETADVEAVDEQAQWDSPLSDFQEGQWWVKELDHMAQADATPDQKRAVAVVHHLLRAVLQAKEIK